MTNPLVLERCKLIKDTVVMPDMKQLIQDLDCLFTDFDEKEEEGKDATLEFYNYLYSHNLQHYLKHEEIPMDGETLSLLLKIIQSKGDEK